MFAAIAIFCALGFSAEAGADAHPSLYSTPYSFVELLHVSAEAAPALTLEPGMLPGSSRLAGEAPRMFSQTDYRDRAAPQASAYVSTQSSGLSRPAGWLAALSVLAVLAFIFVRRAQPLE
jgi:hypothetical protein